MSTNEELVTVSTLARRIGVKSAWLRAEAEAGTIPALKTGDRFVFDVRAVESVLLERARGGKLVIIRADDAGNYRALTLSELRELLNGRTLVVEHDGAGGYTLGETKGGDDDRS